MKKIEYNLCVYNQTKLHFSNNTISMFIHFKCEKCGNIHKGIDLRKAVIGNCYFHCNNCDSYYRLTYDSLDTDRLKFFLKDISKKEVMENSILFSKNGYTIKDV